MPLFRRRTVVEAPPGFVAALTAAAQVLDPAVDKSRQGKVRREAWQTQVWDLYEQVGELHYASNFVASCLSRVRLVPGLLDPSDPTGQAGPAFGDEDPETGLPEPLHPLAVEASDLLAGLRSRFGGQATIMRAFGLNLSIAGECHLWGSEDQGQRLWEVLSTEELRADEGGGMKRIAGPGDPGTPISEGEPLVRVWRPHPRWSQRADSAVRSLLDVLEELVLLTRGVRATTTSRLAGAGILFVAEEIDYPAPADAPPGSEEADPFTTDLITAMTTPVSDKGSAAAVVPMVVRAPGEWIDKGVRHLDFTRNFDSYPSVALRDEAVKRFAQGIDLPVEVVTGQGGANHWSAWQIDESTFKAHIEPLLELITDALTTGYLRPGLLAPDPMRKDADVADLVVGFDASELVVHPNRSADATLLYDRIELSGRVLRSSSGFSEDDAPDDEERARRLAERPAPVSQPPGGSTPNQSTNPEQGADEVEPGTPNSLAVRIAAAAEVAVERAVERAGARLRSKANGATALRDSIGRAPSHEVASLLGPSHVAELIPERDLFAGEFGAFARSVCKWAAADGIVDAGAVAERALAVVERLAMARLYGHAAITPEAFSEAVGPEAPSWPRVVHAG